MKWKCKKNESKILKVLLDFYFILKYFVMYFVREINKIRFISDNFKFNLGYVYGNFIKIVWFNKNLCIVVIYVNKLKIINNYISYLNFFFFRLYVIKFWSGFFKRKRKRIN